MPLETATYLTDLVTSNPAHTDGLSQADSHMRLLKSTMKATFPNFTSAALVSTQAQIDLAASQAAGAAISVLPLGSVSAPSLTFLGNTNCGMFSPAGNQIAFTLGGSQVMLMGGSALVTSLGISAAAVVSSGAYSGGTGQLVPVGGTLLWWDDVLPTEGGYAWANGQIIASANTVCPILLARWGTRFGGNGTTTMGVPDMRNTVPMGRATMGGTITRGLGILDAFMGTLTGLANNVLIAANLPPITSSGSASLAVTGTTSPVDAAATSVNVAAGGNAVNVVTATGAVAISGTASGTVSVTSTGTSSTAVNNVQPSTTCNYIIRLA